MYVNLINSLFSHLMSAARKFVFVIAKITKWKQNLRKNHLFVTYVLYTVSKNKDKPT